MRTLFTQDRVAASAGQFLDRLLGDQRRKTRWARAEAAGDRGPWRQQARLISTFLPREPQSRWYNAVESIDRGFGLWRKRVRSILRQNR